MPGYASWSLGWGGNIAAIISAFVPYLWITLAAAVLFPARHSVATLLGRLGGLEIFGVKLAMASGGKAMNAAISMGSKHHRYPVDIPDSDRKKALARAEREQELLSDAEILWVDDRPTNNRNEARMLRSFGVIITFAASTTEALEALKDGKEQGQPFHLIVSDVRREYTVPPNDRPPQTEDADPELVVQQNPTAGIDMLKDLVASGVTLPVIFYVGHLDPDCQVPAHAFGITDRPDQLLQLTLDALARTRS
jgi:CheY-like chemotaxis protein